MANPILIIGESGTGKSTSIRNLDPKNTFIINVIGKSLPFKEGRRSYVKFSSKDNPEGNYFETDKAQVIVDLINYIDKKLLHIKHLIIDDYQYVMANKFMQKSLEKGYDKFTEIGKDGWIIVNALCDTRADLICFVLSHNDVDQNGKSKCKTIGKMLDDKIVIEGMFTVVLHSMLVDKEYKFLTQNDGTHTAKSPMGMFENKLIDNDLLMVTEAYNSYYNEDIKL